MNVGDIQIITNRGFFGKANNAAAVSENHQMIVEHLPVQQVDKGLGAVRLFVLAREPFHPLRSVVILRRCRCPALVAPMGRRAVLGLHVHQLGAYLEFNGFVGDLAHGVDACMQGLVAVVLWKADIVVESTWNRPEMGVQQAQDRITLWNRCHDNPQADPVHDLFQGLARAHHLAADAVQAFGPALDAGLDTVVAEQALDTGQQDPETSVVLGLDRSDFLPQALILRRLQDMKTRVLQSAAQLTQAQPVGDGYVKVEGLPGHFPDTCFAEPGRVFKGQQAKSD